MRRPRDHVNIIVKGAMTRNGITSQEQLAVKMNFSQTAVNHRMTGRTRWTLDDVVQMDQLLHFSEKEIVGIVRGGERRAQTENSARPLTAREAYQEPEHQSGNAGG